MNDLSVQENAVAQDYKVADISLAAFGRREVTLAEAEMPALMTLRHKYAAEKPLANAKIVELIREHFELRPKGLIKMLDLIQPIYRDTAAYGHFGREDLDLSWEKTDKADALKAAAGL